MDINSHKVLLFDIDGTLLEPAGIGRLCCQRALEDVLGFSVPTDGVAMAGRTDWGIVNDLLVHAGLEEPEVEAQRDKVFDALSRHIAAAAPSSKMHILPGVKSLLNHLEKDARFILGLVTGNVQKTVVHKLQAVSIDPGLFTFGAFGDEHIDRNTLPALALYRLSQMIGVQVPAERALVIGDTPHDITCAQHAGIKVLSVATGLYSMQDLAALEPDFLLEDLSDTPNVVEVLEKF
ncbi:MAG: HAD family hydrolase [Brevefilum sp.]|nr:HAD family hydrolase [Brevefilum sp.]MDT8382680.1 HAD family hydrolase [Brevefilum sp.]MDW7754923.1 HAD family hydrolase [Brevefilum sp.]